MWLFRFHLVPQRGSIRAKKCVGAYAALWISFPDQDLAEVMARHCLTQDGWRIKTLDAVNEVDLISMRQFPKLIKYYEVAKRDGLSILISGYRDEKARKS
jgi:hypothetical protein